MKIKETIFYQKKYLLKHPVYTFLYLSSYFLHGFKQKVDYLETEKVFSLINKGASIIRFGDGEINMLLDLPMPYHEPNRNLKLGLRQLINEYTANSGYILAVPKHITLTNKELSLQGKKRVWLPFKIFYFLSFPKKVRYADAHMFYSEEYLREYLTPILKSRSVIMVTKAQTIDLLKRSRLAGNNFSFVRTVAHNAYNEYEKIKNNIEKQLSLFKEKEQPIIIFALGPVGKMLAFQYHQKGIQCIDVGKGLESVFI